jgi:hypothetical protein
MVFRLRAYFSALLELHAIFGEVGSEVAKLSYRNWRDEMGFRYNLNPVFLEQERKLILLPDISIFI